MTTEVAAVKREPQVAIVPLNAIDVQDVASSAATFDAWLQSASGGVVTLDRIKNVARRVLETQKAGNKVVVVVSAMSGVTDGLIKLAKEIMPLPPEREMDMLLATGEQQTIALTAMALEAAGVPAASLTGAQAGIVTDGVHTNAAGIPTYGVSGMFADPDGQGVHGLNERIRVKSLLDGRAFLYRLTKAYTQ